MAGNIRQLDPAWKPEEREKGTMKTMKTNLTPFISVCGSFVKR